MDTRQAMGIGTAGFTAALAIHRLLQNGQTPELGPVAVTGATGGVGSLAIGLLAGLGFRVTGITSKTSADDYLRGLGASEVLHLQGRELGTKPLEKPLWGGGIDNLGAPPWPGSPAPPSPAAASPASVSPRARNSTPPSCPLFFGA